MEGVESSINLFPGDSVPKFNSSSGVRWISIKSPGSASGVAIHFPNSDKEAGAFLRALSQAAEDGLRSLSLCEPKEAKGRLARLSFLVPEVARAVFRMDSAIPTLSISESRGEFLEMQFLSDKEKALGALREIASAINSGIERLEKEDA